MKGSLWIWVAWLVLVWAALALTGCGPKAQDMDEFSQKVQVLTDAMTRTGLKVGAVGRISSDKIGSLEQALVGPWDIDVYIFGWSDPAAAFAPAIRAPGTQPAPVPPSQPVPASPASVAK